MRRFRTAIAIATAAQLHKGNIFTSDLHSGLWIARRVEGELVRG